MTATYNIMKMELDLKKAKNPALTKIKNEFVIFFTKISLLQMNTEKLIKNVHIDVISLTSYKSLDSVISTQGFYVILTDFDIENNNCSLKIDDDFCAIYRGEGSSVRRRIESHLFNSKYKKSYELRKLAKEKKLEKFSEPYYGACIKIEPNVSGINIDSGVYAEKNWKVLTLKMLKSTSEVRKQTEYAFDEVFQKPIASRE